MRIQGGLLAVAAATLALLGVACGGSDNDSWSARAIAVDSNTPVQPVIVNSQLGVGSNRLLFGLFDRTGALISSAEANLRLYTLNGDTGTLVSEHELVPVSMPQNYDHLHADESVHTHSGPEATLFVTQADFTAAGDWGAELSITLDGERVEGLRMRFFVLERTSEPMIGEQVPRSVQRVLRDVAEISEIDTTDPPNPAMHEFTVAEALDTDRPLLVAFATPAFCQTRFCGPVIEAVVQPLHERYGDRVEFLHIEPFDIVEARSGRLVVLPIMQEWGLTTEPWVFVIDDAGWVVAKFEGITSLDEVTAALQLVLGAGQ